MKHIILLLFILFFSSCSQYSSSGGDTTIVNNTINYVTQNITQDFNLTNSYFPLALNNSLIDSSMSSNTTMISTAEDFKTTGEMWINKLKITGNSNTDLHFDGSEVGGFAGNMKFTVPNFFATVSFDVPGGTGGMGITPGAQAFTSASSVLNFATASGFGTGVGYSSVSGGRFYPSPISNKYVTLGYNTGNNAEFKWYGAYFSDNAKIYKGNNADVVDYFNGSYWIFDSQNNGDVLFTNNNIIIENNLSADIITIGSNTLDGLSSGDINVSTIYYDTLQAKSPVFQCSNDWCSITFPQYQKSLFIQKEKNWTINKIIYQDLEYTKNEFWNLVRNTQFENIALRLNDKLKKLQDKYNCEIKGNLWDGTCYNEQIIKTLISYNESIITSPIYNTTELISSCTILNDDLIPYQTNCTQTIETTQIIDYTYSFKNNCGWNEEDNYYCNNKIRIDIN